MRAAAGYSCDGGWAIDYVAAWLWLYDTHSRWAEFFHLTTGQHYGHPRLGGQYLADDEARRQLCHTGAGRADTDDLQAWEQLYHPRLGHRQDSHNLPVGKLLHHPIARRIQLLHLATGQQLHDPALGEGCRPGVDCDSTVQVILCPRQMAQARRGVWGCGLRGKSC